MCRNEVKRKLFKKKIYIFLLHISNNCRWHTSQICWNYFTYPSRKEAKDIVCLLLWFSVAACSSCFQFLLIIYTVLKAVKNALDWSLAKRLLCNVSVLKPQRSSCVARLRPRGKSDQRRPLSAQCIREKVCRERQNKQVVRLNEVCY